jgi:hypothetical protein
MKTFPKNIAKVIQLMYDNGYTSIHYFSAMKAMKKTMSFYKTNLSKFDILKDFNNIDKDEFFECFDKFYDKEFKNIGNLKYELYGSTENFNDLLVVVNPKFNENDFYWWFTYYNHIGYSVDKFEYKYNDKNLLLYIKIRFDLELYNNNNRYIKDFNFWNYFRNEYGSNIKYALDFSFNSSGYESTQEDSKGFNDDYRSEKSIDNLKLNIFNKKQLYSYIDKQLENIEFFVKP